jgi:hypothetical protein
LVSFYIAEKNLLGVFKKNGSKDQRKKIKNEVVATGFRTESSKKQRPKFKFEKKISKPPGVSISHQTQPNQKFQIRFK